MHIPRRERRIFLQEAERATVEQVVPEVQANRGGRAIESLIKPPTGAVDQVIRHAYGNGIAGARGTEGDDAPEHMAIAHAESSHWSVGPKANQFRASQSHGKVRETQVYFWKICDVARI